MPSMPTDWDAPPPPDDLTPHQRAAVEHFTGPLLVLAGPGSGKTRVITRRIARLVERGVAPHRILAITFTNKAAREMHDRVQALLPDARVWVSTFHRFCARLLRERGEAVGLRANFTIFDTGDQQQLLKQILHEVDLDAVHFPPAKIGYRISHTKNELVTVEDFLARHGERPASHWDAVLCKVWPLYQQRLLDANAVDFDDLLLHVVRLLREHEELRAELDHRFRFILVDEYQDTNPAQYEIVAQLSRNEPNLCATGDPDQSIYGWRGARIENILRFEREFTDVAVIRLEENFRSTPEILQAADELITHNVRRLAKRLQATHASGPPVNLRLYDTGQQESLAIAAEIRDQVERGLRRWSDFAIFYRVNALSRNLETALTLHQVPHQLAGSVAFYERMEIKDVLGYLRLIENPRDRIAFLRVVNTPPRGLGKTTLSRLVRWADQRRMPLLDAAGEAGAIPELSPKARVSLRKFVELIDEFREAACGPVAELIRLVLKRTGYLQMEALPSSEEEAQRRDNVLELLSAAKQYDQQAAEEPTLTGFLETASLAQDSDLLSGEGAVTLMTLHAAKGLEFPVVYLIGVEQNLIPHERSLSSHDPKQLEEERRLLFVGITRAREELILTHTRQREIHGRLLTTIRSDFTREISLPEVDCSGDAVAGYNPFPWETVTTTRPVATTQIDDLLSTRTIPIESRESPTPVPRMTPRPTAVNFTRDDPAPRDVKLRALRAMTAAITTGAALQATQSASIDYVIGMQVRHPEYGLGRVTQVGTGNVRRRTIVVDFGDDRQETFVAAHAPLEVVAASEE